MTILSIVLAVLGIYLLVGVVFAVLFAFAGAKSIDPVAANATWGFKLIIIPGCTVFWPYLLVRWIRKSPPPEERSAHRHSAKF